MTMTTAATFGNLYSSMIHRLLPPKAWAALIYAFPLIDSTATSSRACEPIPDGHASWCSFWIHSPRSLSHVRESFKAIVCSQLSSIARMRWSVRRSRGAAKRVSSSYRANQIPDAVAQLMRTRAEGHPFFIEDLTQAVGVCGGQLAARGAGTPCWSPQAISICDGTMQLRRLGTSPWLYRQNTSKYI
jgi:hypothetical protein